MSLLKPLDEMFSIRCASKLPAGAIAPVLVLSADGQTMVAADPPVTWKLLVDENLPQKIFADNDRLRQVLTNLCDNAIKFTAGTHARTLGPDGSDSCCGLVQPTVPADVHVCLGAPLLSSCACRRPSAAGPHADARDSSCISLAARRPPMGAHVVFFFFFLVFFLSCLLSRRSLVVLSGEVCLKVSLVNPNSTRRGRPLDLLKGTSKNQHQSAISQQKGAHGPNNEGDDYKQVSTEKRSLLQAGATASNGGARPPAAESAGVSVPTAIPDASGSFFHKVLGRHKNPPSHGGTPSHTANRSDGTLVHSPDAPTRRLGQKPATALSGGKPIFDDDVIPTAIGMARSLHYHPDGTATPKGKVVGAMTERREPLVPENVAAQFVYLRFSVSDTGQSPGERRRLQTARWRANRVDMRDSWPRLDCHC